jgi:hypothetical protein
VLRDLREAALRDLALADRFGAISDDLRAVVEDTDDEPTLVAWLRLAGTRSADEIATAIRSFRAS